MRTITLILGKKEHVFIGPSNWSEVPEKMALRLFRAVKAGNQQKHIMLLIPMLLYKIPYSIMKIFLDARRAFRKYQAGDDDENYESLALLGDEILNSCRWVYSDPAPNKWLLKSINLKGRPIDAPTDRITNLTFGEFVFTENHNDVDRAKLCAVLYRKRPWYWFGARGKYDHTDIEKHAEILRQDKYKEVIDFVAWNYSGMVQHLHNTFPEVFPKPASGAIPTPRNSINACLEMALSFCDNDSIRFHALEEDNLYLALKMINNRIRQNKEIEAKYQK